MIIFKFESSFMAKGYISAQGPGRNQARTRTLIHISFMNSDKQAALKRMNGIECYQYLTCFLRIFNTGC